MPVKATARKRPYQLYFGDNLEVLNDYIADESVDLVYLDPPFNSQQDFNLIFKESDGSQSSSQRLVFSDTWKWTPKTDEIFDELIASGDELSKALTALKAFLDDSQVMAYLVMMAPRLRHLWRVLKPTGALYLHCDPTASHYLKVLLDAIFGQQNFINEIVWKRSQTRSSISKSFRCAHDILLFYSKSEEHQFTLQYRPLSAASLKLYKNEDHKGKYQAVPLLVSGKRNGETGKVWRGIDPNTKGKAGMHWVTVPAKLEDYNKRGLILWPEKKGGSPRLKYYLEQSPGVPLDDFWEDIDLISSSSNESMRYPTQKPEALLKRIIEASSKEGDVILDPFCGCGTAVATALRMKRKWIGIDVTHLALAVIKSRLARDFGLDIFKDISIIGEPISTSEAAALATQDKYGFQYWAVGKLGAPPIEQKKGADQGVDGRIRFFDDGGAAKQIIISVKAGDNIGPAFVRELRGVVEREKAEMGILVCVKPPTAEMTREARRAGSYLSFSANFPKLQIITIDDMFADKPLNIPGRIFDPYQRKKPTSVAPVAEQLRLLP